MKKSDDKVSTIKLRESTKDRLSELGDFSETYEDVVNRLIDIGQMYPAMIISTKDISHIRQEICKCAEELCGIKIDDIESDFVKFFVKKEGITMVLLQNLFDNYYGWDEFLQLLVHEQGFDSLKNNGILLGHFDINYEFYSDYNCLDMVKGSIRRHMKKERGNDNDIRGKQKI
jgi:hypothetical protein